jgi:hypothetical protein
LLQTRRVKLSAVTGPGPQSLRAAAQALIVAPVVITSSTSRTGPSTLPTDRITGGAASLSCRPLPRCLPDPERAITPETGAGTKDSKQTSRASNPAGSKPRSLSLIGDGGTATTAIRSISPSTCSAMYPAIIGASPDMRPNL